MSRKAGTPNKPKVNKTFKDDPDESFMQVPTGYKDDKFEVEQENKPLWIIKSCYPYNIVEAKSQIELKESVNWWIEEENYQPLGGVSVTNYRANDGNIVMVYCQALVKKE